MKCGNGIKSRGRPRARPRYPGVESVAHRTTEEEEEEEESLFKADAVNEEEEEEEENLFRG